MIRLVLLVLTIFVSAPAVAQEWGASSSGARKNEIVKRYKTLLERTPSEGIAYKRLLDYVGKGKQLDRLIEEYSKKVEANPDKTNYRLILGHFLKAKNDYESALVHYDKAVELSPDDPLTWMSRGSIHLLLQHGDDATSDFEKALSLEKNRDKKQNILRKLADASFARRDWEGAQKYYEQLVGLDPRNEYLRLEYAQVLIQYKRYEKALEQYQQLVKLAGRDTKAKATTMRDIGDLYEKMGQDDKAIETYKNAQKLMRSGHWLHNELEQRIAGVYRRTDRLSELIAKYEKRWQSPSYEQSMLLANLYDEVGRENDALKYYQRAIKKNRNSTEARTKEIRILERRGEEKRVIAAYQSLIRVAPRQSRYQFDLVNLYFRIGDRKRAVSLLKKISSRFSREPQVLVVLADAYLRAEMNKEALSIYKKLVRVDPRNDAFILGLGEYYYQSGELDLAVKTWEKLLDTDLEKHEAYARLGQVLASHGMVDKGLSYFEKAAELSPNDVGVRRGLALSYERARRWRDAVETWEFLLSNNDQPLIRNEARGRIINLYERQNQLSVKIQEYKSKFNNSASPDYEAGFFLAAAHTKRREYTDAEEVLSRIARDHAKKDDEASRTTETMALVDLEKLYTKVGSLKKAISVLERLAELQPARKRDYYHQIAEHSLKLYQDDQAVHYATLAVQANPDDAAAYARLGDVYVRMGSLPVAVEQYEQAIDIDPRAFEVQFKLAEALLKLGKFKLAGRRFREIVKKSPDESMIDKSAKIALNLAEASNTLSELEVEFSPLVYRTPPKPIYRSVMLNIYDRATALLVDVARFNVGEVSADAERKLDEIGRRALPILVDAVQSKDGAQRATALRLIGDLRQGGAALAVGRIVDNPKDGLRIPAVLAVAQIGDPRGSVPLLRVVDSDNPQMRELVIWALGSSGGDAATKKLGATLTDGHSRFERSLAAISLGRIGSRAATKALRTFIEQSNYDQSSAAYVLWGLGRAKDAEAVPLLIKQLESKSHAEIAAWGLARIGGADAAKALLEAYWSSDPSIRSAARLGLAQFATGTLDLGTGTDEVRREIPVIQLRRGQIDSTALLGAVVKDTRHLVTSDKEGAALVELAAAMGDVARSRLAVPEVRDLVLADLSCDRAMLGLGTVMPCSDAWEPSVKDKLTESLRVAATAIDAEFPIGAHPDALGLIAMSGSGQSSVFEAAGSSSNVVRRSAARALAYLGGAGVDALVKLASDSDSETRAQAMRGLGLVASQSPKALNAVVAALKDPSLLVRIDAAVALGRSKIVAGEQPLIDALSGAKIPFARAILGALYQIAGPKSASVLNRYKSHADHRLAIAAEGYGL